MGVSLEQLLFSLCLPVYSFLLSISSKLPWEWFWDDARSRVVPEGRGDSQTGFWGTCIRALLVPTCSWSADRVSVIRGCQQKKNFKSLSALLYHPNSSSAMRSKILTRIVVIIIFSFNQPGNDVALWNLWKAREKKEKGAMESLSLFMFGELSRLLKWDLF